MNMSNNSDAKGVKSHADFGKHEDPRVKVVSSQTFNMTLDHFLSHGHDDQNKANARKEGQTASNNMHEHGQNVSIIDNQPNATTKSDGPLKDKGVIYFQLSDKKDEKDEAENSVETEEHAHEYSESEEGYFNNTKLSKERD